MLVKATGKQRPKANNHKHRVATGKGAKTHQEWDRNKWFRFRFCVVFFSLSMFKCWSSIKFKPSLGQEITSNVLCKPVEKGAFWIIISVRFDAKGGIVDPLNMARSDKLIKTVEMTGKMERNKILKEKGTKKDWNKWEYTIKLAANSATTVLSLLKTKYCAVDSSKRW